jgi:hypothetical protein
MIPFASAKVACDGRLPRDFAVIIFKQARVYGAFFAQQSNPGFGPQ